MQLLDRVISNINLCAVELSFNSSAIPSNIDGWQPFYNSTFLNADFEKAYASLVSINFDEESFDTNAGTPYKQKISFRFPNSDANRASRIELMKKVNFIKLKQTNGLDIIIGRNDFNQNAKPKVKVKQNEQICEVSFETSSITPSGYTPNINQFGLPTFIPITLI